MKHSGDLAKQRRKGNARALAAFGISTSNAVPSASMRTVREGNSAAVFTIGYEGRDGEEVVSLLREAGVEVLADVRERPVSRKPDFRAAALRARCEGAGITYSPWPQLGSPQDDRKALRETGDIRAFRRRFRAYARKHLKEALDQLADLARTRPVALMCYERSHEDCHRSDVADFLADRVGDASIVAIV